LTRRLSHGAAEGRKSQADIRQCFGPEPVWAGEAGYNYVPSDDETNALMALRAGLQAQIELLDSFIVGRLEEKLRERKR
jgi:hypothetical protein